MKRKKLIVVVAITVICSIFIHHTDFSDGFLSTTVSDAEASDTTTSKTDTNLDTRNQKDAAPVSQQEFGYVDGQYILKIPSSIGIITYYNQHDIRWADSIFGGSDTISHYGCGPTVLSMLVTSFTNQNITPDNMAKWACANDYWCEGSGSKHSLIPEGAAYYGLGVESCPDYTVEQIIDDLQREAIFVALVGPGQFTDSGHFIILANYWAGTTVNVVDPNNIDNCRIPFELQPILDELYPSNNSGGPLWKIYIK